MLALSILATMAYASPQLDNTAAGNELDYQRQQRGGQNKRNGDAKRKWPGRDYPAPKSAWEVADLLIGCPTDTSVKVVVHPKKDLEGYIQYGLANGPLQKTTAQTMTTGKPLIVTISGLKANNSYTYHLMYRQPGQTEYQTGPANSFQTQRLPGTSFTFYVQGDSHPERMGKMNDPILYERTLKEAAKTKPDFFVCLGDDFSVDTLNERTQETVNKRYSMQAPYLGLVSGSAALYLVNGNHEQAAKANLDGTPNSLGAWAQNARNSNFAQPEPDGFYTGDPDKVPGIGLLKDYYAWTWGDALFVVIDPYWHSDIAVDNSADGTKKNRDLWQVTLGDAQYQWLKKTLETSKAKFKFVFSHHVMGTGRGGVEVAPYYEWGGKDRNGQNRFAEMRPGWAVPIHQLFVKTGVSAFFQGHDHIFCKQELDGVIYQTVPCPADSTYALMNDDAYQTGTKLPGSGLVRVTVSGTEAKVDYVRSWLTEDEKDGHKQGEVAFSYILKPKVSK